MRVTNYLIDIELENNRIFLVHGYTGSYLELDKERGLILAKHRNLQLDEDSLENIFSDEEIKEFSRAGIITYLSEAEDEEYFERIVTNMHNKRKEKELSYLIIPSYDCSFNCSYCFQNEMREERGDQFLTRQLTTDQVDNIFKAMDQLEELHGQTDVPLKERTRNITFYGGEPFLPQNRDIIEYIFEESAKRFKPVFAAISNGYDLDHYKDLLIAEKIDNIQVTLDGVNETNNKRRKHKSGSIDTFGKIMNNIQMLLDSGVKTNVRMNIDKHNLETLKELNQQFEKRGWFSSDNFKTTLAPVFTTEYSQKEQFTSGHLHQEMKPLREHDKGLERLQLQYEQFYVLLNKLFEAKSSLTEIFAYNYCSAPTNMYGFDAHGSVYTCMEKTGKQDAVVAKVKQDGKLDINQQELELWRNRTVLKCDKCRKCAYALFCGGGCANKAEILNGTIYSNHCDGFQHFFKSSVAEILKKNQVIQQSICL